jgi:Bacteriophage head to tail connecting protein.
MAGKVLELQSIIEPDRMGTEIARNQYTWNMLRQPWIEEVKEIRQYIYATDTTKTSNSKLPWKNKTVVPKLCQIRDNLYSNYMASLFPKRKWLEWVAEERSAATLQKKDAITSYMCYVIAQKSFKDEVSKCIQDYIDYGNCFSIVEWQDFRVPVPNLQRQEIIQVGYAGPGMRRISPLDIVFNPIAPSFDESPKIIRSLVSIGEVKDMLEKLSDDGNRKEYMELYTYLKNLRKHVQGFGGELHVKDEFFRVDGFDSYQAYLQSSYCEILTYYGDIYDTDNDTFLKNQIIMVIDRHKVLSKKTNPSFFGKAPIHHVGWRRRQDNLWAMSPLANLVGLQYRIDHIENMKADCFDLITFPPLKIKGYVEDFEWGPMSRIHIGDDGDVEMLVPPFQVLQANTEIQSIMALMEELAGAPKEAMGFRTPGEKTKYEVQRMENAASRIFQNKTVQFDEQFMEPNLNSMLEIGRRRMTNDIIVKYFDDELKIETFMDLSPDDISGEGRIKPFAARHFAEQAELVQNLNSLSQSPVWQQISPHFSTIKMARMFEDIFDITDYKMVMPYVAIAEQADAEKIANAQQEQILMEALTPTGLTPDDVNAMPPQQMQPMQNMQAPPQQGQPGGY